MNQKTPPPRTTTRRAAVAATRLPCCRGLEFRAACDSMSAGRTVRRPYRPLSKASADTTPRVLWTSLAGDSSVACFAGAVAATETTSAPPHDGATLVKDVVEAAACTSSCEPMEINELPSAGSCLGCTESGFGSGDFVIGKLGTLAGGLARAGSGHSLASAGCDKGRAGDTPFFASS